MNILHMKYAVEIAKAGSINKAAGVLLIAQPNLSRAVKELEADLGITIFDRSAKGMVATAEGEEFLAYARAILGQINEVEALYKTNVRSRQKFSASVPRSSYISEAFSRFSNILSDAPAKILYKETNSYVTINDIAQSEYKLGIIRYGEEHDRYFKSMLEEKDINFEVITDFKYVLIMNAESRLAAKEEIFISDLYPYIEIMHADLLVQGAALPAAKHSEPENGAERKIYVFERAAQFELLSENKSTFMWVDPVPEKILARYGLVQRKCSDNNRVFRDMMIYRNDYRLTGLDNCFISEVCKARRKYLGDI